MFPHPDLEEKHHLQLLEAKKVSLPKIQLIYLVNISQVPT